MGKHHQASRRKAYGRRRHEVRERAERNQQIDHGELVPGPYDPGAGREEFAIFGLGAGRRLHFALGD